MNTQGQELEHEPVIWVSTHRITELPCKGVVRISTSKADIFSYHGNGGCISKLERSIGD